VISGYIYCY